MKVAYIHTSSDAGAANVIQVKMMTQALESLENVKVDLFIPKAKNNGKKAEFTTDKIFEYPIFRSWSVFKYLLGGLMVFIRQRRYELIYFRNPAFLLPFIFLRKPKLVYEIHNNKLAENRYTNRIFIMLLRLLNTLHSNRLKVIVISNNLMDFFEKKIPKLSMQILHDGIDLEMFKPINKKLACKKLHLDQSKFRVCYAGSLKKDRNIEDIIELAKSNENIEFLILGGIGVVLDNFRNRVEDEGIMNLDFTGRVPHHLVNIYLSASDVLLGLWSRDIPTFNYCSPLKVFEYLAMNRLVVFHELPTIKEITNQTDHIRFVGFDGTEEITKVLRAFSEASLEGINNRSLVANYTWKSRALKAIEF